MILIWLIRVSCGELDNFFGRGGGVCSNAYFRKFYYVKIINLIFPGRVRTRPPVNPRKGNYMNVDIADKIQSSLIKIKPSTSCFILMGVHATIKIKEL